MARFNKHATSFAMVAIALASLALTCLANSNDELINAKSLGNSLKPMENFIQQQMGSFKDILQPAASISEHFISQQYPDSTARHHLGLAIKDIGHKINFPLDEFVDKAEVVIYAGLENMIKIANVGLLFVERAILPDVCFLRSMCYFGTNFTFLRHMLGRISPSALEGSIYMRAITRGILGVTCDDAFYCANPVDGKSTLGQSATSTLISKD